VGKILNIVRKDLTIVFGDKMTYLYLFLTPLVLIVIFGFALGGAGENNAVKTPVIYNHDDELSVKIVEALGKTGLVTVVEPASEEEALKKVGDGDYVAALVLPPDATSIVSSGRTLTPSLFRVQENDARVQMVKQAAYEAIGMVLATENPQDYVPPQVMVQDEDVQEARSSNAFDQYVPGYAVMFMLFGVMSGIFYILEEKEQGTLRRLFLTPASKFEVLAGKESAVFILVLIQAVVLFAAGWLLFKINVGKAPLAIVALVVSTSLAAVGLGTLLSTLIKQVRQVSGIVVFAILVMSALGGSWWPLWIEPPWLRAFSYLTLNGWAMNGFNKIMIFNRSFSSIIINCVVLAGMGILFFAIGVMRFNTPE
jgi:ABC-2 type transport system permease protein